MIGQLDGEDDSGLEYGLMSEPLQVKAERSFRMQRSAAARRAQKDVASQPRVAWLSEEPKLMD